MVNNKVVVVFLILAVVLSLVSIGLSIGFDITSSIDGIKSFTTSFVSKTSDTQSSNVRLSIEPPVQ